MSGEASAPRREAEAIESEAQRAARGKVVQALFVTAFTGPVVGLLAMIAVNAFIFEIHIHRPAGALAVLACFLGSLFLVGTNRVSAALERVRLRAGQQLIDAGHFERAIRQLKLCEGDEAAYLVGVAYDRAGHQRLAEETYRQYLEQHDEGKWRVEARVRLEELEALRAEGPAPASPPQVQAQRRVDPAKPELRCPFCRDGLAEDALTAECATCGTPHHLSCYEEQGGCAVYGCDSKTVRARVQE